MKNTNWGVVAAWIGTSVAVIVALLLTKNVNCLWAFLLPAGLGLSDMKSEG